MNYQETIEFLNSRDLTMRRYERESWDSFLAEVSFSISFPFIHITGTNGKGSTAKYIYEIYRNEGYKVALFSKPYFYKPNEMIVFDGKEISDEDFASIVSEYKDKFVEYDLSSFEIETFVAFIYFSRSGCDLAIIECGMGGYTDSTNIPNAIPLLSIITTISLEHTAFLGSTLTEIAANKAGIIKSHAPVLVGDIGDEAAGVIKKVASRTGSNLYFVNRFHHEFYKEPYFYFDYGIYKLRVKSAASYLISDAILAVEAVNILKDSLPVKEENIVRGIESDPLPGRFEIIGNTVLDGGHCPEGIEATMRSIENYAAGRNIHVLFASFKDKNIAVEFPLIDNVASSLTLTTFSSPRARDEMDYFIYTFDHKYENDCFKAYKDLKAERPDDLILITGSLAFVGIMRESILKGE